MKQAREEKKKPAYNVVQNTLFTIKKLWVWDHRILLYLLGKIPVIVLLPLCTVYLPKVIVGAIEDGVSPVNMVYSVGGIALIMLVLGMLKQFIEARMISHTMKVNQKLSEESSSKAMSVAYEVIDRPKTQVMLRKAYDMVYHSDMEGIQLLPVLIGTIIANALGFGVYTGILGTLNPWIIVFIIGTTLISYFVSTAVNKWVFHNRDKWLKLDLKLAYLTYKSGSFETAKDIRLYHMKQWFYDAFHKFMNRRIKWTVKMQGFYFVGNVVEATLMVMRDGLAYGYLIYLVWKGSLSVADFVLYFGIIGGFANWCMEIIQSMVKVNQINFSICDLREYFELPDYTTSKQEAKQKREEEEPYEIAFCNVSYCYEGEAHSTLKNLNLVIKPGEKIAVVGANGAGKTTFVKLLCGLYTPSEGCIKVNGQDIATYNQEDYYGLLGPVFQDIRLLPISIGENITLCDKAEVDQARLASCLALSGMDEVIKKFDEGLETLLIRDMSPRAVQLSGGEEQKLMLARALYKNAPIMILDEPTAALDPIAENAMYLKYNELTAHKTSVFISHRLASTRFCDRIILMADGRIVEVGTHEELLELGEQYAQMFEIQAKYYREQEEGGKHCENISF
ncbi:MAG: ABC transporter ATP-binding protein [Cellulosilyticaceae bacterium]